MNRVGPREHSANHCREHPSIPFFPRKNFHTFRRIPTKWIPSICYLETRPTKFRLNFKIFFFFFFFFKTELFVRFSWVFSLSFFFNIRGQKWYHRDPSKCQERVNLVGSFAFSLRDQTIVKLFHRLFNWISLFLVFLILPSDFLLGSRTEI